MTTKKLQFVTAYGGHDRLAFETTGESMAQQHFQKECDIREIIKRNDRTGIIEHVNRGVAQYADVSDVKDYKEALEMINSSMESFMGLPSDIRKLFDNDPGEFFEFATNPANAEKMAELGLAPSPAPAAGSGDTAPVESAPEAVDTDKSEA
jgi:phage internal scaffolding protein